MAYTPQNYLWSDFQAAVTGLLTTDADREGLSTYLPAMIRQGVINVQQAIPLYRKGHETLYLANDFVSEGRASRGVTPPQSVIRDVWMARNIVAPPTMPPIPQGKCERFPMDRWAWEDRMALIHGDVHGGTRGKLCMDPQGYTFYVYPEVFDCWMVSFFWDGLKLDFANDEETPFNEPMTLVVADFAKAHIKREVESDLAAYESYMKSFATGKQKLAIAAKERE